MEKTVLVMGILNMTPDSFSDGGAGTKAPQLIARIDRLLAEHADIIDVGGESTRPFARQVTVAEELARILPALNLIRERSSVPISIDTTKAVVAREALAAGATIINDISALRHDSEMVEVVRACLGPVIIMHRQGNSADMQIKPHYEDVVSEINIFFAERIAWMTGKGIDHRRIVVDPGVGFGKTLEHNLAILRNIQAFKQHGCPVLIGHSRKSFLGQLLDVSVTERDCPTAVVSALSALQGADILRVHDVGLTHQALKVLRALR